MASLLRFAIFIALLGGSSAASAAPRLVSIGSRKLSINCAGPRTHPETVVLIAGLARTAKDWAKVQPAASRFARVCSYDLAGLGKSDKPLKPQTMDEIIDDLRALLTAAGERPPYVLVGHSIAGIYSRRFVTRFPDDVSALLFVDSSHEEQFLRLQELNPSEPPPSAQLADVVFTKLGQRLEWQSTLPLIVLARGTSGQRPARWTEEQFAAFDHLWRELQQDLAKRSPRAQFRIAERSGHFVQIDEPEMVIQAIRDLTVAR